MELNEIHEMAVEHYPIDFGKQMAFEKGFEAARQLIISEIESLTDSDSSVIDISDFVNNILNKFKIK